MTSSAEWASQADWRSGYDGLRVLVTGHSGFKGSWLAIWLNFLGAKVHGLSLQPEREPALFTEAGVDELGHSSIGDVRRLETVMEVFEAARPEIVFHLAAQSLVRRGYAHPVDTYETNVMGTVNVLEAARQQPELAAVVVVTSDKCYEDRNSLWSHRETDPLGGRDPYSSSKACAEMVTAAYRDAFFDAPNGPLIASARAGNVFGGGDWSEDRLVPDIARSLAQRVPVVLRNPDSIRPWQHVLEPIRGYLMLGARLLQGDKSFAEGWNFGPPDTEAITVRELAERMIEVWGAGTIQMAQSQRSDHPEAEVLRLDPSKARRLLGYRSLIDLQQAIELTVEWYDGYHSASKNARELTLDQIGVYSASFG